MRAGNGTKGNAVMGLASQEITNVGVMRRSEEEFSKDNQFSSHLPLLLTPTHYSISSTLLEV